MSYFYFSYAQPDRGRYIERFYHDLSELVATRRALPRDEAGFFDAAEVQVGSDWSKAIAKALGTCQTFVPLLSPSYFKSEHCGKEWAIFRDRIDDLLRSSIGGLDRPLLMLPVLWKPPSMPSEIPLAIADIQYASPDFPEVYVREGLLALIKRRGKYQDEYREFLWQFADKLLAAGRFWRLPPKSDIPPFESVVSAFHRPQPIIQPASTGGPRYAQFYYVAARASELTELRHVVAGYGVNGGPDWLPFYPPATDTISMFAQRTATDSLVISEHCEVDDSLSDRIMAAQKVNKIAIIVVDPWSLRVGRFRQALAGFNRLGCYNNAVVIVWNKSDDETARSLAQLEAEVQDVFRVGLLAEAAQ